MGETTPFRASKYLRYTLLYIGETWIFVVFKGGRGIERDYSRRIIPMTSATACMSDNESSYGSYSVLSEMMRIWFVSVPGFMRFMMAPCVVSRTYGLFHWKKIPLIGTR